MRKNTSRGFALALTLFIIVILAIVCFGALNVATLDSRTATEDIRASRAFYAARAGIAYAKSKIAQGHNSGNFNNVYLDGQNGSEYDEHFSIVITPAANNDTREQLVWRVESEGKCDGATRKIVAFLQRELFSVYGYFTDIDSLESAQIFFIDSDRITGKVHTNTFFSVSGHPQFNSLVTSANENDSYYNSSSKSYKGGSTDNQDFYRANSSQDTDRMTALDDSAAFSFHGAQPRIDLPESTTTEIKENSAKTVCTKANGDEGNCSFVDSNVSNYRVIFSSDSSGSYAKIYKGVTKTTTTTTGSGRNRKTVTTTTTTYSSSPDFTVDTTQIPTVMYFSGAVETYGTVKGRVTMACTGDVNITDNLSYSNSKEDVLGLMAEQNVIIKTSTTEQKDIDIDASIMALKGSFTVDQYNTGVHRGAINFFGSLVQYKRGAVGQMGNPGTGYDKNYVYDEKLRRNPPAYWPWDNKFDIIYFVDKGSLGGV